MESNKISSFYLMLIISYLCFIIMNAAPIMCSNFDMKKPPRFGKRSNIIAGYHGFSPCLAGPMRRMSIRRSPNDSTDFMPLLNYIRMRQRLKDWNQWYPIVHSISTLKYAFYLFLFLVIFWAVVLFLAHCVNHKHMKALQALWCSSKPIETNQRFVWK